MEKLIIIGGSAGCLKSVQYLLQHVPSCHQTIVLLVVHRQRNVRSILDHLLSDVAHRRVVEPDDKTLMIPGHIYLAPQNYHMLVEEDGSLALEYSEPEHFSRPSIDATMSSAAIAGINALTGILLSGANSDGAEGLQSISRHGGRILVQNPEEAEFSAMPAFALALNPDAEVLSLKEIGHVIQISCGNEITER